MNQLAEVVSVFKLEGSSYSARPAHAVTAPPKNVTVMNTPKGTKTRPKAMPMPAARPKKLAVAGGGSEEWEEF